MEKGGADLEAEETGGRGGPRGMSARHCPEVQNHLLAHSLCVGRALSWSDGEHYYSLLGRSPGDGPCSLIPLLLLSFISSLKSTANTKKEASTSGVVSLTALGAICLIYVIPKNLQSGGCKNCFNV